MVDIYEGKKMNVQKQYKLLNNYLRENSTHLGSMFVAMSALNAHHFYHYLGI